MSRPKIIVAAEYSQGGDIGSGLISRGTMLNFRGIIHESDRITEGRI